MRRQEAVTLDHGLGDVDELAAGAAGLRTQKLERSPFVDAAPLLEDPLRALGDRPPPEGAFQVPVGECAFVDTTALGSLVRANQLLNDGGRGVVLVAPTRESRRALVLTGLDRVFAIHDSRESALGGDPRGQQAPGGAQPDADAGLQRVGRARDREHGARVGCPRVRCECGDARRDCAIELTRTEYESVRESPTRFAIVRNHENPESDTVVAEYEGHAVIEKLVGEISRQARRSSRR